MAKMSGDTKGKWRKSPARFSKEAFPWTTSLRNIPNLAVKGRKMQKRVVNAHFGLLLSSNSTKVKTSEMTSIPGKMPLRTMYSSACPLLTTFLSFGFLCRNPGFLPSDGAEDSEPELERRRRRLQQAEEPQRGIFESQFGVFTSSLIYSIRFEDNWGVGSTASQLIALPTIRVINFTTGRGNILVRCNDVRCSDLLLR